MQLKISAFNSRKILVVKNCRPILCVPSYVSVLFYLVLYSAVLWSIVVRIDCGGENIGHDDNGELGDELGFGSHLDTNINSNNKENHSKDSSNNDGETTLAKKSYKNWFHDKYLPFHFKVITDSENVDPGFDTDWSHLNDRSYIDDPLLKIESPFASDHFLNCSVEYQSVYQDDSADEQLTLLPRAKPIQVLISGANCIQIKQVLLKLRWSTSVTHLIIRDTSLFQIPKYYFGDARLDSLRRLELINNRYLISLDQRAFDGLSSLNILRIISNDNLQNVNQLSFVGVKKLTQLVWTRNGVLSSDLFSNLTTSLSKWIVPSLVHLYISSSLPASSSSAQSTSHHFISADLKLAKTDLSGLNQLQYLHLVNCNIKYLNPLSFQHLSANLKGLSLSGNSQLSPLNLVETLSNLPQNGIDSHFKLLDLSGTLNSTTLIKSLLFVVGKHSISTLYLNSISLRMIYRVDIPPMPYLEELFLDHNPIEFIEDNAFDLIENLSKLSLRGNYLRVIRSEHFYNLPKLTWLDISGNPANRTRLTIEERTFVGVELHTLNLSYKLLNLLQARTFLGLHKTEQLFLRGCDIRVIEYLTFFFVKSLKLIDLSENDRLIDTLRESHDDSFFGLETIETFLMSASNLTTNDIGENGIFQRIHEQIQLLDLSHNRIQMIGENTLTQFPELQSLNISHNQLNAWSNYSIMGKQSKLMEIDLSFNRLSLISSSMLEDFYRLTNISFGNNPLMCDCQLEIFNRNDWLNQTIDGSSKHVRFLDSVSPLNSKHNYRCISSDNGSRINLGDFIRHCAIVRDEMSPIAFNRKVSTINSYLVIILTLVVFTISIGLLTTVFVYYSTLNKLFNGSWKTGNQFPGPYQYDAFVSYNVNDSEWIFNQLVPNIEQKGANFNQRIKLCVYDRDFIAGRPISECILESIKLSRRVILIVSNNFIKSPWCRFEIDLAHNTLLKQNRDGLILVKLEEIDTSIEMPVQLDFLLQTRIYLQWNWHDPEQQTIFWNKLKRSLGFKANHFHHALSESNKKKSKAVSDAISIWFQNARKSVIMFGNRVDDLGPSGTKNDSQDSEIDTKNNISKSLDNDNNKQNKNCKIPDPNLSQTKKTTITISTSKNRKVPMAEST